MTTDMENKKDKIQDNTAKYFTKLLIERNKILKRDRYIDEEDPLFRYTKSIASVSTEVDTMIMKEIASIKARLDAIESENNKTTDAYVIKKIWIDSMENEVSAAFGYKEIGIVLTEQEARNICEKGKLFTKKDCWAIGDSAIPEYVYEKIDTLK